MTVTKIKAKLLIEGEAIKVYGLIVKDKCEVVDFLEGKTGSSKNAHRLGLKEIAQKIAQLGYEAIPEEQLDCWKEKYREEVKNRHIERKCQLCELRKDKWRVSAFKHEDKLLLATVFRKKGRKEKKEYRRAVLLNADFSDKPVWED